MSKFRTKSEKRKDTIKGLILTALVLAGIAFGVQKLVGWDKILHNTMNMGEKLIQQDTTPKTDTIAVHDTIQINNNVYKDSIQLEYTNGHHFVVVDINGVKIKGMLDSGCTAGISGCAIEYAFLHRHGYVKHPVGGSAIIANGDTVHAVGCMAYNVSIGNITFDSVECSFINTQNAQVLIGQGILKQLGSYVINYENNKLYIK